MLSAEIRPPRCPGMTSIDKERFNLTVKCEAIEVPATSCTKILKHLKGGCKRFSHLQHKPKTVVQCPEDDTRKLILIDSANGLPDDVLSIVSAEKGSYREIEICLTYKHWSATQILRAVLPDSIDDTEIISSFEAIGHIAHLNLKECHENYKTLIGQVIMDKNPCIKTVVNKLNTIHSQFRFFDMEVLAGEANFITTAIENKVKFSMDFSKVYWNSKLGTEHKRVVELIPPGSTVLDLFCGIGPFAIPLAKKKCHVHANDLNPESHKYLLKNIHLNRIDKKYITCYNEDGREFVTCFSGQIDYVLMNLPASAAHFLDVFKGLYFGKDKDLKEPTILCYHFAESDEPEKNSIKAVNEKLGCTIDDYDVHLVRKTAPKTWMTCIQFKIPRSVLHSQNENKRLKLDCDSES